MENRAKRYMTVDPEKREIVFTRVFDAPRDLVFKVYTDPKLLPQWWGPARYSTTVERMEVRPGGVWRFIQYDADGKEFAFNGVYREIVPPERLVYTFEFEGMPGHILLETIMFEDQDGKTKVTAIDGFQNIEDLEGMVQSGMEEGAVETYDRLADLLQSILAETRKRSSY